MANIFEYAVKASSLLSKKDGKQYAFLFNGAALLAVGAHAGAADATYETALVNALQNSVDSIGSNAWALCTYAPTSMCLGMAHSVGINGIMIAGATGDTFNFAQMKSSSTWKQEDFGNNVPSFRANANLNEPFDIKKITTLAQAEDAKVFSKTATDLLKNMNTKAPGAYTTRVQESSTLSAGLEILPTSEPPGGGAFALADEVYTHIVFGMVGQTWNPTAQATHGRDALRLQQGEQAMGNNIAGILLDENYQIVAWALNFVAENRTFHAETLMLQRFLRKKGLKKLPPNYTIYSSLQPCDMCASFMLHVGNNTNVVYCLRDVSLRTVLTGRTTGTKERLVNIGAASDIAAKLAEKNKVAQTHSAGLLRDSEDAQYRQDRYDVIMEDLWLKRNRLTPDEQAYLTTLQNKKRNRVYLNQKDFDWLRNAENFYYDKQIPSEKFRASKATSMQANSPLKTDGSLDTTKDRLGFSFVKSADKILDWSKTSKDLKQKKAAQQGVEVFEAIVAAGMSTAYGLKLTDLLFSQILAKPALVNAAAAVQAAAKPS